MYVNINFSLSARVPESPMRGHVHCVGSRMRGWASAAVLALRYVVHVIYDIVMRLMCRPSSGPVSSQRRRMEAHERAERAAAQVRTSCATPQERASLGIHPRLT